MDKVLLEYTNKQGVICRVVQVGDNPAMRRVDRWFNGSPKDRVGKWLPWLQSNEATEILEHRDAASAAIAESNKVKGDYEALKAAHDLLFVERESLKAEIADLKKKP